MRTRCAIQCILNILPFVRCCCAQSTSNPFLVDGKVANLAQICYGETDAMDFDLYITYRTRMTQTPTYLASLIYSYTPSRTLRSSDQLLLTAPRVTLTFSAKAFSVNAPAVSNSLSLDCRSASSLSIFKRRLKSELFTSAYGPTQPVQTLSPSASDSLATNGAIQI